MIDKIVVFARKIRFAFFAWFLLVSGFSVFAFDFGGLVTNSSSFGKYGGSDFELDQKNSASVWFRAPFEKSGENHFAMEFVYNFEADKQNDTNKNILDLNLFEFQFFRQMNLCDAGFKIGRFYFSDLTGKIYSQNSDGLLLNMKNNWVNVSAYAAYTGLLNALNTEIITTSPDDFLYSVDSKSSLGVENSLRCFNADYDKIYDFAEKYVVADFALSFPYLFANQTIAAEVMAALRLENDDYNRIYTTFLLEGPVWNSLFYNVSSTLGVVDYDGKVKISNFSEFKLEYFAKQFSFAVNALYASGEQGNLSAFVGFTKNASTYSAQKFLYSGIIKTGVDFAYRPFECILFTADSDVIFNASAGDNKDDIEFYGFQYSVGAVWQLKSDFQLGFAAYQFIDKDNSENVKKTCFDLKASLAF